MLLMIITKIRLSENLELTMPSLNRWRKQGSNDNVDDDDDDEQRLGTKNHLWRTLPKNSASPQVI